MAFALYRDASGKYDFTSKQGKGVSIKVSGTNGHAGIASTLFNGAAVAIVNNDSIQITIASGINILTIGVLAQPNDTVQVFEVDGNKEQLLEQYTNTPDPITGVPDPLTGFSVYGF